MTTAAVVFLILAIGMGVLDWLAVARRNDVLEYISKPAATAALLGVAATLDVARDAPWVWLLIALVFCLLGDVFLMLPRESFIQGLASFAVAQVLFTVSFVTRDVTSGRVLVGLVIAVPAAFLLARRFVAALRQGGRANLVVPVALYITVISIMAVGSVAAGSVIGIAGAILFMISDSLIAESRFVKEQRWHGVGIMVTYHAALVGLVLSLL